MSINAIYYDEFGKRICESVEDDSDKHAPRERTEIPQASAGEVFLANKGAQRRPALSSDGRERIRFWS